MSALIAEKWEYKNVFFNGSIARKESKGNIMRSVRLQVRALYIEGRKLISKAQQSV